MREKHYQWLLLTCTNHVGVQVKLLDHCRSLWDCMHKGHKMALLHGWAAKVSQFQEKWKNSTCNGWPNIWRLLTDHKMPVLLVNPRNSILNVLDVLVSKLSQKRGISLPMFRQWYFSVTPAHLKQVKVRFWIHKIRQHTLDQPWRSKGHSADGMFFSGLKPWRSMENGSPWEILFWISHWDPRATVPTGI